LGQAYEDFMKEMGKHPAKRKLLGVCFIVLALMLPVPEAHAATIEAASCSAGDVQSALDRASSGDTVSVPAGTCSWTTAVLWAAPANVTFMGAGTSATGGGDRTVIVDDYAANSPLLSITVPDTGAFRMSGMTFQGGSGVLKDGGMLQLNGPGMVRLDHLHLSTQTYSPSNNLKVLVVGDGIYGVLDHSILDLFSTSAIYIYNGAGSDGQGNTTWASDTNFGVSSFFFIEDNIIHGTPDSHDTRVVDCFTAGRFVIRFNSLVASCAGEVHATGHAGDDRGCRAQEIYGNLSTSGSGQTEPNFCLADIGSGTALVWGNQAPDIYKNVLHFNVTRKNNATYSQQPTPSGWGYCGTEFNGTGSAWDGNTNTVTGYPCIDQPGRGKGDLLTGTFPDKVNSVTGTIDWPDQALEPMYFWGNVASVAPGWGGSYYANDTGGRIVEESDYYPQASGVQTSPTSPFDGTSGAGWGTLANRPATCTPGVGYFATDEGSWNTSTSNPYGVQENGADGVFYKCTAADTWTLYYTPYTYPHPLTQTGNAPAAPTNLRID
jgi:hypothetical protein